MARHGLTQLPRRLLEHTGRPAPTYRRCFDAAVQALIPVQFCNGRWGWDDADLDAIAEGLGLTTAKPAPTRSARKASQAPSAT